MARTGLTGAPGNGEVITPPLPTDVRANTLLSRADWDRMRAACESDPGGFHGEIAARHTHWFDPDTGAWLQKDNLGRWRGWIPETAQARDKAGDWTPWSAGLDESAAPYYRWFVGGLTNAAFNEVDRHVFAGHGAEIAYWYEGDRWDGTANKGLGAPVHETALNRRELMLQSVLAALALKKLGLGKGDRIALNMPNCLPQIVWTEAAKRLGIIYTAVFGGFSDKTLADRIENAGARVVITADGASRNAENVPFKEAYTDPALERYIGVGAALDVVAETAPRWCDSALTESLVSRLREGLADDITTTPAEVMHFIGMQLAASPELQTENAVELRAGLASALARAPRRVERVIVVRHAGLTEVPWTADRDVWAEDLLAEAAEELRDITGESPDQLLELPDTDLATLLWKACPCEAVEANFPLFIIYTSGSTGKPKGVVHCHGYIAGLAHTMSVSFDAVPGRDRIYVVADPGWITGQSYLISASLAARIPGVVTEGAPVFPHAGRFASIIQRHGITLFKAGVTFLKTVMTNPQNQADVERYDMSSLRVATFCAEPTSPPVQRFGMELMTPQYINSYWATEHGGIVWTHPYGNRDLRLRSDTHCYPLPWVFGDVWVAEGEPDEDGHVGYRVAEPGERGEVVITRPYPYLARTVWGDGDHILSPDWQGDNQRFREKYFDRFTDESGQPLPVYVQGDFAVKYEDTSFTFHGRSDDVINVSGHRMGTEEIEGAILKDKTLRPDSPVGNCIVVGAPHRDKGQAPVAFVLEAPERVLHQDDINRLQSLVREEKGAVAVPQDFIPVSAFPETRSGKYMRRMLKALILEQPLGDTSTLRNPECLDELGEKIARWRASRDLAEEQQLFEDSRFLRIQYDRVPHPGKEPRFVATLIVRHPPVNALSERVLDELAKGIDHLDRRDDVKAVVVTGAGPSVFVAGADVRELLEDMDEESEVHAVAAKAHAAFGRLEAMNKPVVAAIQGPALGGGCELAMACHYRVGSRAARLGQPEINLFLPPGYGGTQRLPRLLESRADDPDTGIARALGILLSGRSLDAERALEVGLVDEIVAGSLDPATYARELAMRAAAHGEGPLPTAMQRRHERRADWRHKAEIHWAAVTKDPYVQECLAQAANAGRDGVAKRILELVKAGYAKGMDAGLEAETQAFAEMVMDPESGGKRGIRLFLDKRSPALPLRPRTDFTDAALEKLVREHRLLPVGRPFHPGVTAVPEWQHAWAVTKDPATGKPRHGEPAACEQAAVVPVPRPEPNQALLYVLASEMNFNDVWAITGVPISVFDLHDEDVHVTGSGALGMIVGMGEALQAEGRLQLGDVVSVYSGVSDLLDPRAGEDPMHTRFVNQGYESPDGSHQQFMVVQGPQCTPLPAGVNLEQAGSYILGAGTVYRCLTRSLAVEPGKRLLAEGAASGTGHWAIALARSLGLRATGIVSSDQRAADVRALDAGAVNRAAKGLEKAFVRVPPDPAAWPQWEEAGTPFLEQIRAENDGELVDYAVSHAGENAFPRSFQALAAGGIISFYGASSGYHMTFLGKEGAATPADMLRRAGLRAGETCLTYYGTGPGEWDGPGLEAIEAARGAGAQMVVVTRSNAQRDFVLSLGYGDAVVGAVSLEWLERREPDFRWPETMPELPDPVRETESFKETVRAFGECTFKPLGQAVGTLLRSSGNPKGIPDIVIERAGQDSLAVSTMLVAPYTGRVVYFEDCGHRRYSFYAPQVWNRQRRILMPTAAIHGTHLCNAAEVADVRRLVESGVIEIPAVHLFDWNQAPEGHQAIWENRLPEATGGARKALLNHALPGPGIRSRDELLMRWAKR